MKRFGNGAEALEPLVTPAGDGPTTEKSRKYGRARRLAASTEALRPVARLAREVL